MWLTEAQAQTLVATARAQSPQEVCGIIAGQRDHAIEIIAIPNIAADPIHSYYMDERRLVETLIDLEKRGLDVLGFYHSHPQGEPIPSPTDVKTASYPDTPYLIIGLKGSEARLAAWKLQYGQVSAVSLHVGTRPSAEISPESSQLSDAQKIAILLSAMIAFILVIVLSLSLLPPAPLIPR